jgi:hypothetical protein
MGRTSGGAAYLRDAGESVFLCGILLFALLYFALLSFALFYITIYILPHITLLLDHLPPGSSCLRGKTSLPLLLFELDRGALVMFAQSNTVASGELRCGRW